MRIRTPNYLHAEFFMRDETPNIPEPCISPHQVHGKSIVVVSDDFLPERPEADGVLLTSPGVGASLRFADCAPVLLWGEGWVMILHSGFKGTVLNISGEGLDLVRRVLGDGALSEAGAWVGPCIGREHYCRDISDEWTQKGLKTFHRDNYDEAGGKIFFDLAGEIVKYLIIGGIKQENITCSGINTFTNPECFSYRRGDLKERMTLYARLTP